MDILRLASLVLGFGGSLLLSLGLLKSRQQIDDETTPFWGPNPFLRASTRKDQVYVLWGFALLVTGFAFQASSSIWFFPKDAELICAISVGSAFALLGILLLFALLRARDTGHRDRHESHFWRVAGSQVRGIRDELKQQVYKDHPDLLPEFALSRARNLRYLKGDISNENWNRLYEDLINKLENLDPKTLDRIETLLAEFQARYFPNPKDYEVLE